MDFGEQIKVADKVLKLTILECVENINGITFRADALREVLSTMSDNEKNNAFGEMSRLQKTSDSYEEKLKVVRNMSPFDYARQTDGSLEEAFVEAERNTKRAVAYRRLEQIEYLYCHKTKQKINLVDQASKIALSLGLENVYDLPALIELGEMTEEEFKQVRKDAIENYTAVKTTPKKRLFFRKKENLGNLPKTLLDEIVLSVEQVKSSQKTK